MASTAVITGLTGTDIRFPTSDQLDWSGAMNVDPDYSVAHLFPGLERNARPFEFLHETLPDGCMRFRTNSVFDNEPLDSTPRLTVRWAPSLASTGSGASAVTTPSSPSAGQRAEGPGLRLHHLGLRR